VGVLDLDVPLHEPLIVQDVIMLENRLPDGSTCTMWQTATSDHGHLILDEGLCSRSLTAATEAIAAGVGQPIGKRMTFGYAPGPRTKTAAENRAWHPRERARDPDDRPRYRTQVFGPGRGTHEATALRAGATRPPQSRSRRR